MIAATWLLDARLGSRTWYSQVASAFNTSDGPSRLDFGAVLSLGGRVVPAAFPPGWELTKGDAPSVCSIHLGWLSSPAWRVHLWSRTQEIND